MIYFTNSPSPTTDWNEKKAPPKSDSQKNGGKTNDVFQKSQEEQAKAKRREHYVNSIMEDKDVSREVAEAEYDNLY